MKSLRQVAKELNISISYLSDILNGKKGCNEKLMNKIKEYYPYFAEVSLYRSNPGEILFLTPL